MRIFGLDFIESTHNTAVAYTASYEWYIVLMSCTVAWIGTFAGLNTVSAIRSSQTRMGKIAWGCTGAFALGCAVWSMHFVGMLAYSLPVPVKMNLLITAVSLVPAVVASGFAIVFLTFGELKLQGTVLGGIFLGAGIGTMHYFGMAGMEGPFILRYDATLFALSILIAIVLAILALYVGLGTVQSKESNVLQTVVSAFVMGAAISGMHYTGMSAAYFFPVQGETTMSASHGNFIAYIVVGVTALLSTVAIVSTVVNRMFVELYIATENAKSAAREKSDFLARMSHEIRTPMNAIIGMTRIMSKSSLDETQQEYLYKITKSSSQLLSVINSVLDYSKIDSGMMSVERVMFRPKEVLESIEDLAEPQSSKKNIQILYRVSDDFPSYVEGDPTKLTQILANLVSNALKFTEAGSIRIECSVSERVEERIVLHFSVQDSGIGLSEAQMRELFQPFAQADGSITRRFGGTGLGLAICRELCELMGGRIWVESKLGLGSTFHFTVSVNEGPDLEKKKVLEVLRDLRILLLDDSPDDIATITEILRDYGVTPRYVSSGRDAISILEQAGSDPYDVLIADWRLSGEDGIRVALEIDNNPNIDFKPKTILTSAYVRDGMELLARNLSLSGFVSKPIVPGLLIDAIIQSLTEDGSYVLDDAREKRSFKIEKTFPAARCLLVEDNDFNREVAEHALRELELEVDTASSGSEAIEKLAADIYDVVFMDLQMPEMDGITATREIFSRWPERDIPILALTAHALAEEREKSLAAGMADHLTKPLEMDKIVQALSRHMKSPYRGIKKTLAQSASSAERLDEDTLRIRFKGEEQELQDLLETFIKSYGARGSIELLIEQGESEKAADLAHQVIGSAGYLGDSDLADIARETETGCRTGDPRASHTLAVKFDAALKQLVQEARIFRHQLAQVSSSSADSALSLEELLAALGNALKEDDYRAESMLKDLKAKLGGEFPGSQLNTLQEQISNTEYDEALQTLASMRKLLNER
ncbi:response regulator [Candidatus Marimicrobium litorale]|uniref:histidine kinase n=1 Tax=Candidatus Marimicrobium litorale TaxID=2518991 RepID=A0ABT3TAI9_9GAMM|nr:response regulator [Candidatus Marimicrobium litorale]MCX2979054.1 response regulator [Candidatus Marimicrobium litorale]